MSVRFTLDCTLGALSQLSVDQAHPWVAELMLTAILSSRCTFQYIHSGFQTGEWPNYEQLRQAVQETAEHGHAQSPLILQGDQAYHGSTHRVEMKSPIVLSLDPEDLPEEFRGKFLLIQNSTGNVEAMGTVNMCTMVVCEGMFKAFVFTFVFTHYVPGEGLKHV